MHYTHKLHTVHTHACTYAPTHIFRTQNTCSLVDPVVPCFLLLHVVHDHHFGLDGLYHLFDLSFLHHRLFHLHQVLPYLLWAPIKTHHKKLYDIHSTHGTHTHTHTHTHTRARTHAHTHARTHARILVLLN